MSGQNRTFRPGSGAPQLQQEEYTGLNGSVPHDPEPEDLAPFPVNALPPALRDMAQAIKASLNVTLESTGPLVLAAVSGSLGKGLQTQSGSDLSVFANLFYSRVR
jgi:hypothetical protein